ncbi:N-acetylmuramate alpha-1-phosphate uridylyltransferase MurU [Thalassotalea algicola]|nr:nucleotidyltransferase family protein [Thalassotalea algicola]
MILAAGRGERMRPLTDVTPKPLLQVAGKALIEYHLELLAKLGIENVIINHAWLGEKIPAKLGNGASYGVSIEYSDESTGALETAGGIIKALPLLGDEPFLVINGDIFLVAPNIKLPKLDEGKLAHLWLVENPSHNLKGDFYLDNGLIENQSSSDAQSYTFSGVAIYRPAFFEQSPAEQKLALAPLLRLAADKQLLSGEVLTSEWTDVGTPQRLDSLNRQIKG